MKTAVVAETDPHRLRVLVYTPDGLRRSRLEEIVVRAGHDLATAARDADIVLADGDCPIEGVPVTVLGSALAGAAGSLDRDATPEQIDAALRAVSAGLVVRSM